MLTEHSLKVREGAPPGDGRPAQLQRILESRAFHPSEVLRRLLEYLGRKELQGEAEDLKEYTVGIEAFGKPDTYDPKTDSSVRVQAGKLRQKLDEYYRTEGLADPLIVELPKGHSGWRSGNALQPRDTTVRNCGNSGVRTWKTRGRRWSRWGLRCSPKWRATSSVIR